MMESIQYGGGMSSVRWRIFSTNQYGGCTSSAWWSECSIDLSHHQYGEGLQYRTTKSVQGVVGGCIYLGKMIFYRQSCCSPDFILLWLNPDVAETVLGC